MSGPPVAGSVASASKMLSQYQIKKGETKPQSVTGMNNDKVPLGSYYIKKEDYENFLSHIANFVYDDRVPLGLVERPLNEKDDGTRISPIRIDLDLRFKVEDKYLDTDGKPIRQTDHTMIIKFIECVWNEICKILDFTDFDQEEVTFYVLQKPNPELGGDDDKSKKVIKDGIHIFCKNIQVIPEVHLYLRYRVLSQMRDIFPSEFFELKDYSENDMYDQSVLYKSGWMIHGNTKKLKKAYEVAFRMVYRPDSPSLTPTIIKTRLTREDNKQLVKVLSIRYGIEGRYVPDINEDIREDFSKFVQENPITRQSLELNAVRRYQDPISRAQAEIIREQSEMYGTDTDMIPNAYSDALRSAAWLVDMLSSTRATSYDTWINVGICLRNMCRIEGLPDVRNGNKKETLPDENEIVVDNGMFQLWVEFSRKSPRYIEGTEGKDDWYNKYWLTFSNRGNSDAMIKRPTLRIWAKNDSPERYKIFMEKDVTSEMEKVLIRGGTEVDMANLARLMYGDEFICAHIKTSLWYHFDKSLHRYVKSDSATSLRHKLSNDIRKKFEDFGRKIRDAIAYHNENVRRNRNGESPLGDAGENTRNIIEQSNSNSTGRNVSSGAGASWRGDDDDGEETKSDGDESTATTKKNFTSADNGFIDADKDDRLKTCGQVFTMLGKTGYLDKVITECKHKFYETYKDEFLHKLDTNKNLVGFNNGVYDLENAKFREGRPEDMISLSVGYDYMSYDESHTKTKFVYSMFEKIFVDVDVREYMLAILASCLRGENFRQEVYFLNGIGANGKSVLAQWMLQAFGEYGLKPNVTLLTDNRTSAQSASPETVSLKAKRFVYMEEPDEGDNIRINNGLLKDYSGGGTARGRALYGDLETFPVMFKIFFSCNSFPKITTEDAMWRRLKVVEMKSRFLKDSDPIRNPEREFRRNEQLVSNDFISKYVGYFMSIMVHYYNKYWGIYRDESGAFIEPEEVLAFSTKKRAESETISIVLSMIFTRIPESVLVSGYIGDTTRIKKELLTIQDMVKVIKNTIKEKMKTGDTDLQTIRDALKHTKDVKKSIMTYMNIMSIRGIDLLERSGEMKTYYPFIETTENIDDDNIVESEDN
jgi:hypothetical protein